MSQSLYSRYVAARADHPQLYARDLAALLETSEAQLAAARVGHDARRLADEPKALLGALASVGELKAITRNDWAVHEQVGHYVNQQLDGHAGLILNPGGIDLRLFLKQWHSVFVLEESSARGVRHSLQFFDAQGDAIHKVYATENSDMAAWQQLIAQFAREENPELEVVAAQKQAFATEVDSARLEEEWRGMTDVHQFYMILHRHRLSRQQAFNSVSDDLARRVDNQAVEALLNRVQQDGNPIMVFVANRGAVQIFTGPLARVEPMRGWLNIFNPEFTLHLRDSEIAESWITRKPTVDGVVTSLELYAADGTQIAQLYGERKEGQPEQSLWREQLAELEESEVTV
ncbi:hemin-degrading factor [Pantoea coffeiphila]|uniref:Hemin-degrading factor n=1 Tax=Pantoea coffeiphila TaxID=1465635 RepID=A0A2S9I7P9_9GAMM|nr:ChuX/HutX family heme-like substrate-binding protein [Pantoea coffeiphila]PRD13823.1 hemin-degrading factor [Pantoea coffeiphila]